MTASCHATSLEVGESLAGTAPTALTWVVVEHRGPWGRDALADAAMSDRARSALTALKSAGAGVLLARPAAATAGAPPGRSRTSEGHEVLLARVAPGGPLLRRTRVDDLAELASWDAEAIAHGQLAALGEPVADRALLVCTQGRRDPCCALEGRALLSALQAAVLARPTGAGVELWECSHLGGHRLSPVTLSLPSGAVHGRLPVERAEDLLDSVARDEVVLDCLRGRSAFPAPLQAADVALRQAIDEEAADAVDVLLVTAERAVLTRHDWRPTEGIIELEARHCDGRAWRALVRQADRGVSRPESCGQDPVPLVSWVVDDLSPTRSWN